MANCLTRRKCKSTLTASGYTQTLAANAKATFTTSVKTTGNAITMNSANDTINLTRAGLYDIVVSGIAQSSADATTVSLQIVRDGVALTTGLASFTPATADGNISNISVRTILEVDNVCPCSNAGKSAIPITIVNTGGEAIYTAIIVTIIKIA